MQAPKQRHLFPRTLGQLSGLAESAQIWQFTSCVGV